MNVILMSSGKDAVLPWVLWKQHPVRPSAGAPGLFLHEAKPQTSLYDPRCFNTHGSGSVRLLTQVSL